MQNDIEVIRADLAAWSVGQPRRVRQAARCLDGWLEVCGFDPQYSGIPEGMDRAAVLDVTVRAVERLRSAPRCSGEK